MVGEVYFLVIFQQAEGTAERFSSIQDKLIRLLVISDNFEIESVKRCFNVQIVFKKKLGKTQNLFISEGF